MKNIAILMRRTSGLAVALLTLACTGALAQASSGLLPLDPGAQGYQVDNNVLPFKEQRSALSGLSLSNGQRMDDHHLIANLVADEQGNYWSDRVKKVVAINTKTGEVEQTPYQGDIDCFANGNIATKYRIPSGDKKTELIFEIGKYGEQLKREPVGDNAQPPGMLLNKLSCELVPLASIPRALKDGRKIDSRSLLRVEHGTLAVVRGVPLTADTSTFPPALQKLMSQPFMRGMGVDSPYEEWFLIKPDGTEVAIPNNPGEATVFYSKVEYLAYMNAYFLQPYVGGRPLNPPELRSVPAFSRLIHGDGRVERFGVPDVIWEPYVKGEVSFFPYYTKRGLLWEVSRVDSKRYKGDLQEGHYLDDRKTKTLRRLPSVARGYLYKRSPTDGCTLGTRTEVTQRHPHILNDYYFINICTEEK